MPLLFVPLNFSIAFNAATIPEDIDSTYPSTPVNCPAKNKLGYLKTYLINFHSYKHSLRFLYTLNVELNI